MAPIETAPGHIKQLALSGDAPQAPPALLRVLQEATGPTGKIDFDAVEAAIVREAVGFLTDPYMDSSQLMNVTDMGARGNEYYEWNGDIPYDARRRMIGLATRLAIFSPPAHHALRLHWTYTLGTGIPRPTSKDEDVQKIIDDLWDDPANFELTTYKGQTEIDTAQQLTGEIFIAIFVDTKTGHCRFRAVPAVDVIEIISDPDDFKRPLYYKVRLHNQEYDFEAGVYQPDNSAAKDDHVFYRDWRNTVAENDPYDNKVSRPPKTDRNTEVYLSHWPLNRIGARGISDFVSASVWINQHKTFMNNRAILTDALAKISFVKTVKGGPAIVSASAGAEQSSLVDNLYGGYEKNPPQAPGSMYVKNQGVDIEQMKVDTGASNATQDGEQLAQMFSTAIGLPTHYSLMSTEAHRLATVTVMELPVLKMYLAAQQFWLDMFRGLIDFSMLQCAIARTLKVPLISRFGQQVINWTALRAPAVTSSTAKNGAARQSKPPAPSANGATKDATSRNGAGGAVREAMDPIEVHGQTAMQAENDQPDAQNEEKAKQRGIYTIDMPPILEKDVQQTITSITSALQAGLLTPEQAAYQVMIALSFEEVSDKLDEWRRYVELQAIKIQQQDTENQQMNRAGLAAKNVKPPPMAAPGGAPPANGAPDGGSGPQAGAAVARESAADAAENGSVMVAVFPDAVTSRRLARYGNEPAADMHVTLCYIGKSDDLSADQRLALHTATAGLAARYGPLEGRTGAVNTFPPSEHSDNKEVVWVEPDVAGLPALRAALTRALDTAKVPYHDDFERYIPHITVEYRTPDDGKTPDIPPLPLRFDALTVCIGPDRKNYALDGAADVGAVREAGGGGHWVTIEEEGIETHIFINDRGLVTKGPRSLIGAHAGHLPEGPHRKVTHHPDGHVPTGHNEHPEYHEHSEKVHVYGKWGPGKGYDVDNPLQKLTKEQSEAGLKTAIDTKKEHDAAKEEAIKKEKEAKDLEKKQHEERETARKEKNRKNLETAKEKGHPYALEHSDDQHHVIDVKTKEKVSSHDTEEKAQSALTAAIDKHEAEEKRRRIDQQMKDEEEKQRQEQEKELKRQEEENRKEYNSLQATLANIHGRSHYVYQTEEGKYQVKKAHSLTQHYPGAGETVSEHDNRNEALKRAGEERYKIYQRDYKNYVMDNELFLDEAKRKRQRFYLHRSLEPYDDHYYIKPVNPNYKYKDIVGDYEEANLDKALARLKEMNELGRAIENRDFNVEEAKKAKRTSPYYAKIGDDGKYYVEDMTDEDNIGQSFTSAVKAKAKAAELNAEREEEHSPIVPVSTGYSDELKLQHKSSRVDVGDKTYFDQDEAQAAAKALNDRQKAVLNADLTDPDSHMAAMMPYVRQAALAEAPEYRRDEPKVKAFVKAVNAAKNYEDFAAAYHKYGAVINYGADYPTYSADKVTNALTRAKSTLGDELSEGKHYYDVVNAIDTLVNRFSKDMYTHVDTYGQFPSAAGMTKYRDEENRQKLYDDQRTAQQEYMKGVDLKVAKAMQTHLANDSLPAIGIKGKEAQAIADELDGAKDVSSAMFKLAHALDSRGKFSINTMSKLAEAMRAHNTISSSLWEMDHALENMSKILNAGHKLPDKYVDTTAGSIRGIVRNIESEAEARINTQKIYDVSSGKIRAYLKDKNFSSANTSTDHVTPVEHDYNLDDHDEEQEHFNRQSRIEEAISHVPFMYHDLFQGLGYKVRNCRSNILSYYPYLEGQKSSADLPYTNERVAGLWSEPTANIFRLASQVGGTATHEIGHAVDRSLAMLSKEVVTKHFHNEKGEPIESDTFRTAPHYRSDLPDFQKIYEKYKNETGLWEYMRRIPCEMFAEGFSMYHSEKGSTWGERNEVPALKQYAPDLYDFFDKLATEAYQHVNELSKPEKES